METKELVVVVFQSCHWPFCSVVEKSCCGNPCITIVLSVFFFLHCPFVVVNATCCAMLLTTMRALCMNIYIYLPQLSKDWFCPSIVLSPRKCFQIVPVQPIKNAVAMVLPVKPHKCHFHCGQCTHTCFLYYGHSDIGTLPKLYVFQEYFTAVLNYLRHQVYLALLQCKFPIYLGWE